MYRALAFALAAAGWLAAASASAADPLVFVASFTSGEKDGGIYAYQFDSQAGTLKPLRHTTGLENPLFLVLTSDQKHLYSTHAKRFGGKDNEEVAAFEVVGRTGELKALNRQSTKGTAACYVDVDKTGKTLVVANYTSGSVAALPLKADGTLGEAASFFPQTGSSVNPKRQKEAHAHSIALSPDNKYAFSADLGSDRIFAYRLDPATAKLTPNDPPFTKTPAGVGPRHLAFPPNGKQLYVINELIGSITVFDYNAKTGALTEKQTISSLPADFKGTNNSADIKITPDGKYLYGTNRGHDSIAAYRIGDDGRLTLIGIEPSRGKGPQNLAITADGRWLLCTNMPGDNIVVFGIDAATGKIKPHGEPITQPRPACILLVP